MRNAWQQIEINRDAGELVEMVHGLRSNDLTCRCYSAQRNEIGVRSGRSGNAVARRATLANRAAAYCCAHINCRDLSAVRARCLSLRG